MVGLREVDVRAPGDTTDARLNMIINEFSSFLNQVMVNRMRGEKREGVGHGGRSNRVSTATG